MRLDACVIVVRLMEELPPAGRSAIYLAGPISRDPAARGWRQDAVRELREVDFDGVVIDPTPQDGWPADARAQIDWEIAALDRADAVLFWVPRVLWELAGLTTNLEWGAWYRSGKAVLGAPPDAPKMQYLRRYADHSGAPQAESLREAVRIAVQLASLGR